MTSLETKWSTQPKTGITDKINDTIKPKGPLKPRVQGGGKDTSKKDTAIQKAKSMILG